MSSKPFGQNTNWGNYVLHHVALCEAPTATIICAYAVTFLGLVVAALGAGVTLGRLPCKRCTICRASLHGHVNMEVYTFERKDRHTCVSPLEFFAFYAVGRQLQETHSFSPSMCECIDSGFIQTCWRQRVYCADYIRSALETTAVAVCRALHRRVD